MSDLIKELSEARNEIIKAIDKVDKNKIWEIETKTKPTEKLRER